MLLAICCEDTTGAGAKDEPQPASAPVQMESAGTLTRADGTIFQATAAGPVLASPVRAAPVPSPEEESDWSVVDAVTAIATFDFAEDPEDKPLPSWVPWAGLGWQVTLRVICVALLFQAFCLWIEISYSKAATLRLAAIVVASGELIVRAVCDVWTA